MRGRKSQFVGVSCLLRWCICPELLTPGQTIPARPKSAKKNTRATVSLVSCYLQEQERRVSEVGKGEMASVAAWPSLQKRTQLLVPFPFSLPPRVSPLGSMFVSPPTSSSLSLSGFSRDVELDESQCNLVALFSSLTLISSGSMSARLMCPMLIADCEIMA